MSHIGCLCGNDVRENDHDNVWYFVSSTLMDQFADSEAFFDLDYVPGEKSDVWHCKECDRLILFDDGGIRVTRYMRSVALTEVEKICSTPDARRGLLYNAERFFDNVDELITQMVEANKCPDYVFFSEFFDEKQAHEKPPLTPSVVRSLLNEGQGQIRHWYRAVMSARGLAIFNAADCALASPMKCWLVNAEDMETLQHPYSA